LIDVACPPVVRALSSKIAAAVTSKITEAFCHFFISNEYVFSRLHHIAQTRVPCL
jgi:hypothetical protein